ncbi:MAG: TetR family transcriptional regulator [Nitrospinaceae bacterium]|nr:MAG: TetR family transcriptional regulator [Nitrospinaceae bacterium]
MKIAHETTEEIKNQILDSAHKRFGKYGFGKTTMAEIAKDCLMSAGNLYRYYPNKKEIGASCARRCMKEAEELWRDVLKQTGMTPSERLEALMLAKLRHIHQEFSDRPPLFELVLFISAERRDLVENHLKTQQSLVAEVLAEGNRSGEFEVPDVLETAEIILAATMKFIAPHFMGAFTLEELEKESRGVVKLLVKGLAKR